MPKILAKFEALRARIEGLETLSGDPFGPVVEEVLGPVEVRIGGQRVLMAGSNNYLGLTLHPEVVQAGVEALQTWGAGTTGSRLANGNFALHRHLEREIADFFEMPYSMVFTTGHQANLSLLGTLAGPRDFIFLDAESHASIYDAARLSGAQVLRFRHNDPKDLEKRLGRLGALDDSASCIIAVEGLYSVMGDTAPLAAFAEIKARAGAYLVVDEAHSVGVMGPTGRGVAEAQGVLDKVDFVVGTFSKSLAGVGGFCASPHPVVPLLHYSARAYMFTASGSPSNVATVTRALEILRREPQRRARVWEVARAMHAGYERLGLQTVAAPSPVMPIICGEAERAAAFWNALFRRGLYTNLFLPPATPANGCLVRTSWSAGHEDRHVEEALHIFEAAGREVGLIA